MQGELIVVSWSLKERATTLLPRRAASKCGESAGGRAVLPAPGRRNADERDDVRQAMATSLPAGTLAALSYGARFVNVILLVITGAIATAVLPYFPGWWTRATGLRYGRCSGFTSHGYCC